MIASTAAKVTRVHDILPIFRLDDVDRSVFYTPGNAVAIDAGTASLIERSLSEPGIEASPDAARIARVLEQRGREAAAAWAAFTTRPFEPECLTLYLSNRCNLGCVYCYAAPADLGRAEKRLRMFSSAAADADLPILPEAVVVAAARLVARNCAAKARPLTLVLHGGGEPTLHWGLLQRVRTQVERIAADHGIGVWAYIATHGILPEERARWLAAHFNLIGLSCDGPADVQNANRPTAGGRATADVVERTAAVLHAAGASYAVRTTITPATVTRQSEIVEYACSRLRARTLRFEPAYDGRRTASSTSFRPEDAEMFVEHFLRARQTARRLGCDLQVSGVRVDEIHGPYCNPLRDVLQITPDGVASACFLSTGEGQPDDAVMALGRLDPLSGEFEVNQLRAQALRQKAARVPSRCESCVNVYHCARDCPDVCVITASPAADDSPGFRCRMQKALASVEIREMAITRRQP